MAQGVDDPLVSTDWLGDHLKAPDIRIVDASWHLPDSGRDARAEYDAAHIPGAVFLDLGNLIDRDSDIPFTMPPPEQFASRARKLGLGDGNKIVIYDASDVKTAARAWWMFRYFGHRDVVILDGGLSKWRSEGRPLDDLPPIPRERHLSARAHAAMLTDADMLTADMASGSVQVVDARGPGRFAGDEPEPRPDIRPGHIPGAKNVPYASLYEGDGTMKDTAALQALFEKAGVDPSAPVATSCGSGITACCVAVALTRLGNQRVSVYDGSWAEWGSREDLPVETGPAT